MVYKIPCQQRAQDIIFIKQCIISWYDYKNCEEFVTFGQMQDGLWDPMTNKGTKKYKTILSSTALYPEF